LELVFGLSERVAVFHRHEHAQEIPVLHDQGLGIGAQLSGEFLDVLAGEVRDGYGQHRSRRADMRTHGLASSLVFVLSIVLSFRKFSIDFREIWLMGWW
jgi:hypothetical protein